MVRLKFEDYFLTMEMSKKCFKHSLIDDNSDNKDNLLPSNNGILKHYEELRCQWEFENDLQKEPTCIEILHNFY